MVYIKCCHLQSDMLDHCGRWLSYFSGSTYSLTDEQKKNAAEGQVDVEIKEAVEEEPTAEGGREEGRGRDCGTQEGERERLREGVTQAEAPGKGREQGTQWESERHRQRVR
uniref:Uncharacterized protein n=1 Tax=Eutreptiella gymnastica TaxID=73025 RepID=A0A7S4G960_9EUGL